MLTLRQIWLALRKTENTDKDKEMKFLEKNFSLIAVITVAVLMLLPFLGLTEFNTKGEPREAVVALSMLKDGDWILPVNNGMDIPYKPPFFHYCIAVVSLLAGHVDEYTSRLPSAIALTALAVGCFMFYRKRLTGVVALSGALLLLTSFEVHRAGMNCRVDMVLTAFTVGAMLLFYRWWERGSRGVPVLAVLCMSGAVLTKGPVGFVVPCFVMGVFTLLRGGHFWRTLFSYMAFALLSCILPALWYVAAWHEGGQQFLDLVYEENIGRMTGTMSYDSHVHPFTYNFMTLITGWAPWVLLLAMSLFAKPWKKAALQTGGTCEPCGIKGNWSERLSQLRIRIMQVPPVKLFTWLGFLLVLFFYCLPSSKRSVYLLPCYPFMAMLIAGYIDWLWQTRRRGVLKVFAIVMAAVALVLGAVFVAVRMGLVPDSIFHGKHAADNIAMLHALRDTPLTLWAYIVAALPALNAIDILRSVMRRNLGRNAMLYNIFVPVVLLFIALDGVYQPLVLNTKSLRPLAAYVESRFHGEPLYQHVEAPMMHFFGADFYLGDRLDQFEKVVRYTENGKTRKEVKTPERGVLVIPAGDFATLQKRHPEYRFTLVRTSDRRISEMKDNVSVYRFEVKDLRRHQ